MKCAEQQGVSKQQQTDSPARDSPLLFISSVFSTCNHNMLSYYCCISDANFHMFSKRTNVSSDMLENHISIVYSCDAMVRNWMNRWNSCILLCE